MSGTKTRAGRTLGVAASCCLALCALSTACDKQVVHIQGEEDGTRVYQKLAEAWCDYLERCSEAAHDGRAFATHQACVEDLRRKMSPNGGELACDLSNDIHIEPQSLRSCLRAFADASCQRLPGFLGEGVAQLSNEATLAGCRDAIDEVEATERKRFGIPAVGSACDESTSCYCVGASDQACGVCEDLPQAGEACLHEQGSSICGGPYSCSRADVCQREEGAEGEPCIEGRCQRGLECAGGTCRQLHREGDPCNAAAGCGPWFVCEQESCRYRPGQGLGEPCVFASPFPSEQCWMGICLNGVCTERPDLGEACAQECPTCDPECLPPYSCVEGTCREIPDCSAGPGEPCFGDPSCRDGYYCSDSDFRCKPGEAGLGQGCVPEGGCELGACDDGHCVLRNAGDACSDDKECATRRCDAGRCAAASC